MNRRLKVVLTVEGIDGATQELTMSELKELPAYEGWGGRVSSTGRITPPEKFTGVTLQTIADLVGGLQEGQAVRVIAEDGYAMTHSYDQIMKGDYIVYDPGTGDETTTDDPLRTVLVYDKMRVLMAGSLIVPFDEIEAAFEAHYPKIVPVLVYERFAGFGLDAARPIAVLLILAALTVFVLLRTMLRSSQG